MAIKTFTTGEVLTAANTNTYLANAGLDYITSAALSSSINIDGCFTSTYANYHCVLNVDTFTGAASNMGLQMRTAGTTYTTAASYLYAGSEQPFTTGAVATFQNNGASAFWVLNRMSANEPGTCAFDIWNPQKTLKTFYKTQYSETSITGQVGGAINVINQFDGMRIYHIPGGTVTGTIRIYGYRQA